MKIGIKSLSIAHEALLDINSEEDLENYYLLKASSPSEINQEDSVETRKKTCEIHRQ